MVVGESKLTATKKCRRIAGNFDCHGDAVVQRRVHCLIEHIQVFAWSHWMPPLVDCLHRIGLSATMVDEFKWNTQNTNKTQLLASNYGTFRLLVVCKNFNPKTDPLLSSSMQQALCKYEMPLESSAKFLAIKRCKRTKFGKVFKLAQSSIKKWSHICDHRGKAVNRLSTNTMTMKNVGDKYHALRYFIWDAH